MYFLAYWIVGAILMSIYGAKHWGLWMLNPLVMFFAWLCGAIWPIFYISWLFKKPKHHGDMW